MRVIPARLPLASLVLLAALGAVAPVAAEENPNTVYNVEIIVFRMAATEGAPENWSDEAGVRSVAGDESASGSSQVGRFVALLPASAYQLGGLEERLRASGGYVPVAHVAWSQTASAWGTRAGFPLARLGVDVPGLTGNVFLERGQFLHLGLSLSWTMAAAPTGLGAAPGTSFTMNETRRVRFYERNYYDHPAFGVLALVTPAQGARPPGR
ncbi:MAG: CsiV family protein [Steroidobacteraceae bacterium]